MEMIQFLEEDKEQIIKSLQEAGSPEKAQPVLEKLFDRLLLKYNEDCAEERARDEARHMMQAVKMMIPMISAAGETRVWVKSSGGASAAGTKLTKRAVLCIAGGIVFLLCAILGFALSGSSKTPVSAFLGAVPAAILGGGLLFFGGRMSLEQKSGAPADRGEETRQVEILVSPERVWSCLRAVVLSADKSLKEAKEAASYERERITEASGDIVSSEEADLFAGLLESAYSRQQEYPDDATVEETISLIKYYLHRKQVETVNFGGGKREWFELLPGKEEMTIRPALVKDGVLVRKGLAVSSR